MNDDEVRTATALPSSELLDGGTVLRRWKINELPSPDAANVNKEVNGNRRVDSSGLRIKEITSGASSEPTRSWRYLSG